MAERIKDAVYGVFVDARPPIEAHSKSGDKYMSKRQAQAVVDALASYGVPATLTLVNYTPSGRYN